MISIKLAFKSVIRRPSQNMAVLLGITLGVSLFMGVQIGGASLSNGMITSVEHALGEVEAGIYPTMTSFFIDDVNVAESLGYVFEDFPQIRQNDTLKDLIGNDLDKYIEYMAERISLSTTVIYEKTGSIDVGKSFVGIDPDENGFGEFYDKSDKVIDLSTLNDNEIIIGREAANSLFLDENPIGKEITISTSLYSLPMQELGIGSTAVKYTDTLKIINVFEDKGRGEESYSNFIVTSLGNLQSTINQTFYNAHFDNYPANNLTAFAINPLTVLGYGSQPITEVLINWQDNIDTKDEREIAVNATIDKIEEIFGSSLSPLYTVSNIYQFIVDTIEASVDSIMVILNVFGSLIAFAAILVIVNIQSMSLSSREKEVGIMRAIGSKKKTIIASNLTESLFLGIVGSLTGILGGMGYGKILIWLLGINFGFDIKDIPLVVTPNMFITSFIAGFLISQVTGLIPAIKASSINVANVLRGISPPQVENFGKKSLYFGLLFTALAFSALFSLEANPLTEGKEAFAVLGNTESIFFQFLWLAIGPSLIFAYYKSKKVGLSIMAILILLWSYFNIFFIFGWIENGNGGTMYILGLMFTLILGSIILVSVNLDTIAKIGVKVFDVIAKNRKTPIRAFSMVSFNQMKSKKMRSTLTFALFASILTLNIFMGSWSYSSRYGFDEVILEVSSDTDFLIKSGQPVPMNIDFASELEDQFNDKNNIEIDYVSGLTFSKPTTSTFLNNTGEFTPFSTNLLTMDDNAMWKDSKKDEFTMKIYLQNNKTGTDFEISDPEEDENISDISLSAEDKAVWKALFSNSTHPNKDGVLKPVMVTNTIGEFDLSSYSYTELQKPGDSVFLNLTDGSIQEFVVISYMGSNPLIDSLTNLDGPPVPFNLWILGQYWIDKLMAFEGLADQENAWIGKTNAEDISSEEINKFLTEVEIWSNQKDGQFRKEFGLFGFYGITVYSIYEAILDNQFRFFNFLNSFVSMGFIVGILGLLVVAFRSVAERKRQIGMFRALGFRKIDIVLSVILELVVMGIIGLVIGMVNGILLGFALTDINSGGDADFLIPWMQLLGYALLTVFSALFAAIIPGIKASKIPASDALRYTG